VPKNRESVSAEPSADALQLFHPAVRDWFSAVFPSPTRPQIAGWPAIARGESTLILAPTGTGKTLAAFLWCINRIMFSPVPAEQQRCRVVYISPIKALAVDVERNLRAPLVGIAQAAQRLGADYHLPSVSIRTGDTPPGERARFQRHPADILITTPESLYLLLTSNARDALRSVEVVVIDEIHAIVPTKRGSHLALSIERLEHLVGRPLQRIGLSATQRPLEEVARFLGGADLSKQKESLQSADGAATSRGKKKTVAAEHSEKAGHDSSATEAPTERAHDVPEEALAEFESPTFAPIYRPITIVDASDPKRLDLRVEVPVEDMAKLAELDDLPSGPASQGPVRRSIWSAIHPKLLEQIRAHRSTLIFVNSRRLAERISGAINELAGETLVRAHHGSVAVAQRKEIEDRLKLGTLRGIVATSSLELGIDMGAIDLVIQIESPPSVASGMQRVGRASHNVGATSNAIIFPKFRADLVACAAITRAMYQGQVESVHYPRNPLDVLAQQIVAIVSLEEWTVEALFDLVRAAAPYAALTRSIFDGVLDMLSGRYPSDEFADLRPRLTWDRITNNLTSRQGSQRVAIINGGTIPDRGLYGVFLAGATRGARVGELDEEMVFESRQGDTIILGASTWRIEEISHNQVVVSPAPGEPGRMPFWKGEAAGRPAEFGRKIGEMTRELLRLPRPVAFTKLVEEHSLDSNAAENLLKYLEDQSAATGRIPSDEDIVIEICRDEMGDRRVCVLTPFGTPIHAPWCMAVTAKLRTERGLEVESMWSDDGFVLRVPDTDETIRSEDLLPTPTEFKELVLRQLGSTSLFAAKFREAAGRALLLPKRRPGIRAPLWQQRKRASDLLAVAAQFSTFPMLLEAYRECIRDVFDLPAAANILAAIQRGAIRVTHVESDKPSPFAASLLFSYVANYIYEGDAPLAERRAQALSIDQSQLEELLGDSDLRELLDAAALDEVEARLQSLEREYRARHTDGVHDLLLKLGDLSESEIVARSETPEVAATISELVHARRAVRVRVGGDTRYIAVEYASRYRDALGTPLPPGLAEVFLTKSEDPLREILRRYARTHGPFTTADVAVRYGLPPAAVETSLHTLHGLGKLLEGEFRPGGTHREWCDPEVLQRIRRKSLARLRREIEPVEQKTFARLAARWQGVTVRRRGLDALLDTVENLQGAALLASELEREILPARIAEYRHGDLDTVMASGQVVWVGVEQVGDRDGRVALYLTESLPLLLPPQELRSEVLVDGVAAKPSEKAAQILEFLTKNGASFFAGIHAALGGGFPGETRDALWELVWSGQISNDTFHPLRDLLRPRETKHERGANFGGTPGSPEFLRRLRSRTSGGGPAQGRWSLIRPGASAGVNAAPIVGNIAGDVPNAATSSPNTVTQWSANIAQQLLVRHGIVLRETAIAENIPRGYPTIYPALKIMEDSGWVRRGMFVAGLGAAQFAMPSAVDMLRSLRSEPQTAEVLFLAATDPANPYGTLLPWPRKDSEGSVEGEGTPNLNRDAADVSAKKAPIGRKSAEEVRAFVPDVTNTLSLPALSRTRGAGVILINGELAAFFRRMNPAVRVFLPESEPELTHFARELAKKFAEVAIRRQGRKTGLLIGSINEVVAREHFLARFLEEAGFVNTALGFQMRRVTPIAMAEAKDAADAAAAEEAANDNDLDDADPKVTGTA
jgi:ATP-dependent helicase Lhr and Lhr-like helicase